MPRPSEPSADDAFRALSSVNSWVNNADAKIGLLAAALTVLAGAVVRQRASVGEAVTGIADFGAIVALVFFGVCVVALAFAAVCLFRGLRARVADDTSSRFAFPYAAGVDLDKLTQAQPGEIRREAWMQVQTLSKIALTKYRLFNWALTWGVVAGLALIGWLVVAPPR